MYPPNPNPKPFRNPEPKALNPERARGGWGTRLERRHHPTTPEMSRSQQPPACYSEEHRRMYIMTMVSVCADICQHVAVWWLSRGSTHPNRPSSTKTNQRLPIEAGTPETRSTRGRSASQDCKHPQLSFYLTGKTHETVTPAILSMHKDCNQAITSTKP